jgi:multicomponent Na+:H+ antiporter subunit E
MLVWNLLLALIWASVTGTFTPANVFVGFVLAYLVLLVMRRALGPTTYFLKVRLSVNFVIFFIWELTLANLRVAYDVLTPRHHMRPAIIGIPLDARTDAEITLLANLISLTPGTLSLDVSNDRRTLYLHAMYVEDVEKLRRQIKNDYERRVLELLR